MLDSTKTLIEEYNTSSLYDPLMDSIPLFIQVVFPVIGSIALIFFGVKIFRKILNV